MTLVYNPQWQAPTWEKPATDPRQLVEGFARLIDGISGVRGLWAILEHGHVHFYTLIKPDSRKTEERLFAAELSFMDVWDEPPVIFHVSSDDEYLTEQLRDVAPVLLPAS